MAKKTTRKKSIGDTKVTVLQYASMTGVGSRLRLWLNLKFDTKEFKTANEWCDILLKEGAISEKPEILTQPVSASK